ncbi:MAG: DUF349 domain-containing protein [Pseudonocardiales bacterium]|nr:DUF349 domain-containing protein [Actinomycetota bacterium]PZS15734.1 MAG: DUF349 domain-containing protein [Pseudonocardiales bacterium]
MTEDNQADQHLETSARSGPRPFVSRACRDPQRWGRIADDGTVHTQTADGERAVGSWQAGTTEEGLAHFARRFDDLLTEAELLESRLTSGVADPKQALSRVRALRDELVEPTALGDLVGLTALLDHLQRHAEDSLAGAKSAREQARAQATARKEALAQEAEQIGAESTQWKSGGDRLRTILDEWKTIKGVDRKNDEALWRRFSKARDAFARRRGAHFAELDRQRVGARSRKEELVAEAETLADSTDWGTTAGRFRALMVEWKAAGRAPKEADDALWQRFRAAQERFFSNRSATFSGRDSELERNVTRKQELVAAAERIDPASDIEAARAQLRGIQESWESIGKVPRERVRELESRLRAVEDRIRTSTNAQWRQIDPESEARVAQFRERVEQYEAQAAKARAAGDDRRASTAQAQADQWREWLAAAEQAVTSR